MTAMRTKRPTYQEAVATFTWEEMMAMSDWPCHEKYKKVFHSC